MLLKPTSDWGPSGKLAYNDPTISTPKYKSVHSTNTIVLINGLPSDIDDNNDDDDGDSNDLGLQLWGRVSTSKSDETPSSLTNRNQKSTTATPHVVVTGASSVEMTTLPKMPGPSILKNSKNGKNYMKQKTSPTEYSPSKQPLINTDVKNNIKNNFTQYDNSKGDIKRN